MTDNEIKEAKSLMWLANQFPKIENPEGANDKLWNCINLYCTNAADLINRQNAEVERYKGVIKILENDVKCAKAEAIKEVLLTLEAEAESSEEYSQKHDNSREQQAYIRALWKACNLVKEMTEQ